MEIRLRGRLAFQEPHDQPPAAPGNVVTWAADRVAGLAPRSIFSMRDICKEFLGEKWAISEGKRDSGTRNCGQPSFSVRDLPS